MKRILSIFVCLILCFSLWGNENSSQASFANNEKIIEMEKKIKTEVLNRCSEKLKKCQIPNVIVDSNSQITNQIIMLLKEKSYASKR